MLGILLIIGIVLVLLVLAVLGLAMTKPAVFTVSRRQSIKARPEKIFPLIANFCNFILWSPFENDPDMKRGFSGPDEGAGAVYAFEGNNNVGAGRVEIIRVTPPSEAAPSEIVMRLQFFRPMKTVNEVVFLLTPRGGETDVSWEMRGPNPLLSKVMQVFFSMDKMVGGSFEKGLTGLKNLAET